MKKEYVTPEVEISVFEAEDIITASGGTLDENKMLDYDEWSQS